MLLETFERLAEREPDAVALIENGVRITRRELLAQSASLAGDLRKAGVRKGHLVALQLPNSSAFVAAFLAALELDLVVAPVDRDATAAEVERVARHFAVDAVVGRSIEVTGTGAGASWPPDTRLLKLTSGSTGAPKAIACSERNLAADARNICTSMDIRPGDVNLGAIPFSHSYGFSNLVTPLLLQGTAVVITNDYVPLSVLDIANRHHCTVAPLIPMVFEHLASLGEDDGGFRTVRTFLSAGAPLPASTSRRFRARFGKAIHSFYGSSETGGITYDREGGAVERGSVGGPLEGVDLAIDRDTQRLTVRSEAVALGVLLDPASFQPLEGRFVTDDLVEQSAEGEIRLVGRAGDLINTAGRKVNPREVEQIILEVAGVREVKVFPRPGGARGDMVAAAVIADSGVTPDGIRQYCRARLSAYKVPRVVLLLDRFPLDDRGKLRRSALDALLSRSGRETRN